MLVGAERVPVRLTTYVFKETATDVNRDAAYTRAFGALCAHADVQFILSDWRTSAAALAYPVAAECRKPTMVAGMETEDW